MAKSKAEQAAADEEARKAELEAAGVEGDDLEEPVAAEEPVVVKEKDPIPYDEVAGVANELDAAVLPLNAGHIITPSEKGALDQAVANVRALAPLPEPEPGTIEDRDVEQELADEQQAAIDAQIAATEKSAAEQAQRDEEAAHDAEVEAAAAAKQAAKDDELAAEQV